MADEESPERDGKVAEAVAEHGDDEELASEGIAEVKGVTTE